jgi:putative flippase GtrA
VSPEAGRLSVPQLISRLRSPEHGLRGQGLRFVLVGGTVAAVYLVLTTILATVVGLPFELALVLAFATSITLHFALQRHFVWVHHEDFALSLRSQAARFLLLAGLQYGITAASTAVLPGALHVRTEFVYLATFCVVTPATFLLFRHRVFHPQSG